MEADDFIDDVSEGEEVEEEEEGEAEEVEDGEEDGDDEGSPDKIYLGGERQVIDMSFHPSQDVLGAGIIDGSLEVFRYVAGEVPVKLLQVKNHKKSCRAIRFSHDGNYVFTGGADRSLVAYDLNAQKVIFQKQGAHNHALTCMAVHQNLVATGDEEGGVKLWDLRQTKQLFSWQENDDFISELELVPNKNMILAPSGDGTLSVFHMRKAGLESQSDNMDDELLSVAVIKNGTKVVCGSQDGILDIWSWGQWGDISDRFPGHPQSIDAMIAIDDDTIVTGSSDGLIRVVGIHPNKMLGIVGEHGELPIECMALSHDNRFLTTSSHDFCIKFWNVSYLFEQDDDDEEEEEGEGGEEGGEEAGEAEDGEEEAEEEDEMEVEATRSKKSKKKNDKKSFFAGLK